MPFQALLPLPSPPSPSSLLPLPSTLLPPTPSNHAPLKALLSVSDKTGIIELATFLSKHSISLIASGGTARLLQTAGLTVIEVATLTKAPEMLGGRVKTLHPAIHAGILATASESDVEDMERRGYSNIDIVVCNL